jgi:hypothetical protein
MLKSCLLLALVSLAGAQEPAKSLHARELFYSGVQTAAVKPVVAATPQAKMAQPPRKSAPKTEIAAAQSTVASPASAPAVITRPAELPGGAHIIPAAVLETPPVGLKYTILKRSGRDMMPVPSDTVFHARDSIQVKVETNTEGYLYIVSQGSSGTWKPMFPSPEVEDGNNHITALHPYVMPPGSLMTFDEQTGTEKLFVVFSREPEPDLEKIIYSLKEGGTKEVPASTSKPQDKPAPKTLMAMNTVDNHTVDMLRSAYSRDLIIEEVDEKTPEPKESPYPKETALFVVSPHGSRVVADVNLVHK